MGADGSFRFRHFLRQMEEADEMMRQIVVDVVSRADRSLRSVLFFSYIHPILVMVVVVIKLLNKTMEVGGMDMNIYGLWYGRYGSGMLQIDFQNTNFGWVLL